MLLFLEDYLQKKLKIAEYLYLYGKNFSREEASREIEVSLTTLNQYASEIYDEFKAVHQGGVILSSQALERVIFKLFTESKKIQALHHLFVHQGHHAKFYTDALMISSASFSRIIASLKDDLVAFDMQIIIRNGYRIEGKKTEQVAALAAYTALFYQSETDDYLKALATYIGESKVAELMALPNSHFPPPINEFGYDYYRMFMLKMLLDNYQLTSVSAIGSPDEITNDWETIIQSFHRLVAASREKVHRKLPQIIDTCYPGGLVGEKKYQIETLLVEIFADYQLFPYGINTLPLRMVYFNRKHQVTFPSRVLSIDTFIYRISDSLRIDLKKRYEVTFYNLLTKDLLGVINQCCVHLYVYSSIGQNHKEYLKNQLVPFMGYFSDNSTIETVDIIEESSLKAGSLIVTTDLLPHYPKSQQFLMSDFISVTDYLSVIKWIIDKVVTKSIRS